MGTTPRLIDTLSIEARILTEARMLPSEGPLTPEQREDVRTAFVQYTFKHDVPFKQVSKQTGYSESVISQFKSGTYKGDVDEVTRVVNAWLERDVRARSGVIEIPYVPTKVAENFRAIAVEAHKTNRMAAIVMPAGSGKTMMLQVLAGEMRGFYIYVDEDDTPRQFVNKLAVAVGAKVCHAIQETKTGIIEKLRGTRRPVFIDEAHRLRRDLFSRIRSIYDQAMVPIIMGGTVEILASINDRAGSRGQLSRRCIKYNLLEYIANVENDGPGGNNKALGQPLFTREEIRTFLRNLNVKFDRDAFELLYGVACLPNHGCLGTLIDTASRANRQAAQAGRKSIEVADVRDALCLVIGLEGHRILDLARTHAAAFARMDERIAATA